MAEIELPSGLLRALSTPIAGALAAICLLVAAVAYTINGLGKEALIPGIEVVGIDPKDAGTMSFIEAKKRFVFHGRDILLEATKKCKGAFQVVTTNGPKIIFPGRYTQELRNIKDLSLNGFVRNDFFPYTPGFEANRVTIESNVIVDSVRVKLTQSLGPVSRDLCEETDATVDELYGSETGWQTWSPRKQGTDLVAALSTRVFLGPVVRKNQEWLRIAVDYTIDMMMAARALRMWPPFLQPVVHWFLPECRKLRAERTLARKIIDREVVRREAEKTALREKGIEIPKTSDSLGWMQEMSHGKPFDLTGGQLSLTFAAIHTTSDLLSKCLFQIARDPQLAGELREEIVDVLNREGWKKTSLYNMKLLDSFMKEVQRVTPASIVALNRYAEASVILSDGTKIPKGSNITVLMDNMHDSSIYPNPKFFDAHRYLKMRQNPGEENKWQFVTTSPEHIGFGHGMHACPGRFFASNEVKVALVFLLLRFEWKVDEGYEGSGPGGLPVKYFGTEVMLDQSMKILYKRRKSEIDIMACLKGPL